jgi:phosphohistidine swiveling domain-containing protein
MFTFCTKANTLDKLRPHITRCRIPASHVFSVAQWHGDRAGVIRGIRSALACDTVIIRSSARGEDSIETSMAGMFDSIPNVPLASDDALGSAVDRVVSSYARIKEPDHADQVLVQPMIDTISMSGVVFTQDLNSGAPYYIINYDDASGRFDSITAGNGDINRTLIVRRDFIDSVSSSRFRALLLAVREIETLTGSTALDIEFIVTADETTHIVQIRPLAVSQNWNRDVSRDINAVLEQVKRFVGSKLHPVFGAQGSRSIFGIMPDWNPVEMLGAAPRKLAASLYNHLITDSVWAEARAEMGYRDMSNRPLMNSLGGRQYIDVRESFNSFLPAAVTPALGEALVNLWLDRLERHPELHDKIEFDVAVTVHTPDFRTHTAPRLLCGLSPTQIDEFETALKELTRGILGGRVLEDNLARIERLDRMNGDIPASDNGVASRLLLIQALLLDCKTNGTKPFSVIARCGFIAESMLRGLVNREAVSARRANEFRTSIKTILSEFLDDLDRFRARSMTPSDFLGKYGHLRPSSYDILSLRYDQRSLMPGEPGRESQRTTPRPGFALTDDETARVDAVLDEQGYDCDCATLFAFMRKAISGREYAKFKFSRHLSNSIELIASWGESLGLTREELAHLNIGDVLACASQVPCDGALEDSLRAKAKRNAAEFTITQALRLPFLITATSDVDVVPLLKSRPNFITTKAVQAPLVLLTGRELKFPDLCGKIILIEGADPGFDWIFAHRIAGLITKHGGANSHMAIRCAELDLPAAIGCGEQLFTRFCQAAEVKLDCASEHILTL